ncbi:MAG: hypothetical protein ACR2QK_05560 [Acidimicrobiales bacterium]
MGRRGSGQNGADDRVDDGFDDHLRAQFLRAFPSGEDPVRVLDEMTPALGRARRVHRTKQAVMAVAASVLLVGGVGLAADRFGVLSDDTMTVAGDPENVTDPPTDDGPDTPLAVTGTTSQGRTESDQTTVPAGTSSVVDTTTSTVETTTTGGPTTTSTDQPSSTGVGSPSTTIIESVCGSIAVSVVGQSANLIESLPAGGYSADEKSTGPNSIEVSFEGGGEHCELKAEMRDGRLEVERE